MLRRITGVSAVAIVVALLSPGASVHTATGAECVQKFHQTKHEKFARTLFRERLKISKRSRDRLRLMKQCQHTPEARSNAHRLERRLKRARDRDGLWRIRWRLLPAEARAWTERVSRCESGTHNKARAIWVRTRLFISAFQWVLDTWHKAGGRGSPLGVSWYEQACRAWRWHARVPRGQWPVCGE